MTEGYFINIATGKSFSVHDHEISIRKAEFAKEVGLSDILFNQFSNYEPVKDRDAFLRWLLSNSELIRVRGHGVYSMLEWGGSGNDKKALEAIHKWGKMVCGPCLMLCMINITSGKQYNSFWLPFDTSMKAGKRIKSVPVEVTTK
jgi:hypothetical protein